MTPKEKTAGLRSVIEKAAAKKSPPTKGKGKTIPAKKGLTPPDKGKGPQTTGKLPLPSGPVAVPNGAASPVNPDAEDAEGSLLMGVAGRQGWMQR